MRAICPGSFDPITRGHLDVIERAHAVFGHVLVAVGRNTTKNYMFTPEERVELVRESLGHLDGVEVGLIDGLLVDYAKANGCTVVVKGLRFASDFDYELQMSHLNTALSGLETVFLPAGTRFGTVSSSMIREVALSGADISGFVTAEVEAAVVARVAERRGAGLD